MSQTVPAGFAAQDIQDSKALDYALVIAGWPTVYTVAKNSYALAGDLANFTTLQSWASIPAGAAAKVKGRPEEGGLTIGQVDVNVLDRFSGSPYSLSNLLSREAYLDGNVAGTVTTSLSSALSNNGTTVTVASTTGFPGSGLIYVGLECIKYTGTTSTTFTGCSRGYLLTGGTAGSPIGTPHASGAFVYSYMPSVYRRRAFIYKGYQGLTLDQWCRAFGGLIAGVQRVGPTVTFSIMSTVWAAYLDGKAVVVGNSVTPSSSPIFSAVTLNQDVISGDFGASPNPISINLSIPSGIGNLGNNHYLMKVGGHWAALTGVV